jgi:hypothetical protein
MIDTVAESRDEFYIGYEERMPPGLAQRVALAVAMFAGAAAVGILIALLAQQRLPSSRFEFGVVRSVTGVLRHHPYPWIDVNGRRVWLVGPGKFGAGDSVGKTPAGPVVVDGTAIQRGNFHMLEILQLRPASEPVQSPPRVRSESSPSQPRVGSESSPSQSRVGGGSTLTHPLVTLAGEIVDSKCFLGVMNPAEGSVHRDCARRCLSGGIPPMMIVRDGAGREELVVLVSADGQPISRDLAPVAGRPVRVTGRLARDGDQYVLYANASAYARSN